MGLPQVAHGRAAKPSIEPRAASRSRIGPRERALHTCASFVEGALSWGEAASVQSSVDSRAHGPTGLSL